uniref:Uncharacterized protein n=1 Tax=Arundo donax TaxID=35708 RepID=A0A0A9GNA8_ARUDO
MRLVNRRDSFLFTRPTRFVILRRSLQATWKIVVFLRF